MKAGKLNQRERSAPEAVAAKLREEGLRTLARMVARKYAHDRSGKAATAGQFVKELPATKVHEDEQGRREYV